MPIRVRWLESATEGRLTVTTRIIQIRSTGRGSRRQIESSDAIGGFFVVIASIPIESVPARQRIQAECRGRLQVKRAGTGCPTIKSDQLGMVAILKCKLEGLPWCCKIQRSPASGADRVRTLHSDAFRRDYADFRNVFYSTSNVSGAIGGK